MRLSNRKSRVVSFFKCGSPALETCVPSRSRRASLVSPVRWASPPSVTRVPLETEVAGRRQLLQMRQPGVAAGRPLDVEIFEPGETPDLFQDCIGCRRVWIERDFADMTEEVGPNMIDDPGRCRRFPSGRSTCRCSAPSRNRRRLRFARSPQRRCAGHGPREQSIPASRRSTARRQSAPAR